MEDPGSNICIFLPFSLLLFSLSLSSTYIFYYFCMQRRTMLLHFSDFSIYMHPLNSITYSCRPFYTCICTCLHTHTLSVIFKKTLNSVILCGQIRMLLLLEKSVLFVFFCNEHSVATSFIFFMQVFYQLLFWNVDLWLLPSSNIFFIPSHLHQQQLSLCEFCIYFGKEQEKL